MKKFIALVCFLFATVPSIAFGAGEDGETVTFSRSGCLGFAETAAVMAEAFESNPKLTPNEVLDSAIQDQEKYKTNPEQFKELLRLTSMIIVSNKRTYTPPQHFQGALNFCLSLKGDATKMIEGLKKNLNLLKKNLNLKDI